MFSRFLPFGLLLLALVLGSGWFRSCQNEQLTKGQNAALNDKVKKTVDALGRANYEVKSFEGQVADLNDAVGEREGERDTVLARLAAVLNERGKKAAVRAAVSFDATAKGTAGGKSSVFAAHTNPATQGDSVRVVKLPDSLVIRAFVTSKRFSPTEPPTFSGQVVARPDSTFVDPYVVRVGFDVVQTETKGSITTTIRPTDPSVEVTSARSFTKELPKKNRGFWAGVGAVAVVVFSILVPR